MRELLQQALNALEYHTQQTRPIHNTELAIDALRSALAAPMPEPVAWRWRERPHESRAWGDWRCMVNNKPQGPAGTTFQMEPLYAAPPTSPAPGDMVMVPRKPTPDMARAGRKAVAAVADKMEAAKQLAVHVIDFWQQVGHTPANEIYRAMIAAAPPTSPAVPLTDAQILHTVDEYIGGPTPDYPLDNSDWIGFARAIEKAHGIGGGNG